MHVLPQLRQLEHRYADELVIIGVHSGKFWAERVTENIRQAVLRLDVEHPVVNDLHFRVWRAYDVRAWPTIVLIDPTGRHVGAYPGEITFDELSPVIDQMIRKFDASGQIDRRPFAIQLETLKRVDLPLAFPNKVLATSDGRLVIADTNHNRVLIVALEEGDTAGQVQQIIGHGEAGLEDGNYQTATFRRPHGLALDRDVLFVADTDNHAIRSIDLRTKQVTTIAGRGRQALRFNVGGLGTQTDLNSPWDLIAYAGTLYIAMAGAHQIWSLDLGTLQVGPYAGSGFEALTDGPLLGAALAQPSGITSDGQRLYIADTESSAIRQIPLQPSSAVQTIVGKGLFDFGDKDGVGGEIRLQHPQGIVWHMGQLYVADTYNNKIKDIDPKTRRASTFLGTEQPGPRDGDQPLFDEPGGISAANGKLFVADTNNHGIRVCDIQTRSVTTLTLKGI